MCEKEADTCRLCWLLRVFDINLLALRIKSALKANMHSCKLYKTVAVHCICFSIELLSETWYWLVYIVVDAICMGLLELPGHATQVRISKWKITVGFEPPTFRLLSGNAVKLRQLFHIHIYEWSLKFLHLKGIGVNFCYKSEPRLL